MPGKPIRKMLYSYAWEYIYPSVSFFVGALGYGLEPVSSDNPGLKGLL